MLHLSLPEFILLIFLLLIFVGLLALSVRRRYKEEDYSGFWPEVLIIVPCKGSDIDLSGNLRSLKEQKYPSFSIKAVIDDENDLAVNAIQEAGIDYLLSTSKCENCSGKVRAIATAIENSTEAKYFAVADSDAFYPGDWLEKLVAPLKDEKFGVSTTFPRFIPVGGAWSKIKSVWGLVGMGLMESNLTRFVWGGSMVFSKDLMGEEEMRHFKQYISDDVAIMRIVKQKKMDIYYSGRMAPSVRSNDDYKTFKEWSNRQTALSVSASRKILRYGLFFYGSEIVLLIGAILFSLFISYIFIFLLTPYILFALRTVRNYSSPGISVVPIAILIPFISMLNLLKASRMKTISWRGNVYDLSKQP